MNIYEKIFLIISVAALIFCIIGFICNLLHYKKTEKELKLLLIGESLLKNNKSFIDLHDDLMELQDMINKSGLITAEKIELVKKIYTINQKRHNTVITFLDLMHELKEQIWEKGDCYELYY